MKSYTKYVTVNTPTRRAFINITPVVEKAVEESGIKEGLCLVNTKHIWFILIRIKRNLIILMLDFIYKIKSICFSFLKGKNNVI